MLFRTLICVSLMLFGLTTTPPLSALKTTEIPTLNANSTQKIPGAAFYIVQYPDDLSIHMRGKLHGQGKLYYEKIPLLLPIEKKSLRLAYYNTSKQMIAIIDIAQKFKDYDCVKINIYAQKRLDPEAKIEIFKAIIKRDKKREKTLLYFYDKDNNLIASYPYTKGFIDQKKELAEYEAFFLLNDEMIVKDEREIFNCPII